MIDQPRPAPEPVTEASVAEPAESTGELRLRPMRPVDLDALLPYEQDMFGTESWSRASYLDELADPDTRYYLVAERVSSGWDVEVLGCGGLMVIGETAQILTVGVLPHARRQGVAGMLVRALLTEAVRRRADEVLLEVRIDNQPARSLYERHGFQTIGTRRGYYDRGRVDAVVMRHEL